MGSMNKEYVTRLPAKVVLTHEQEMAWTHEVIPKEVRKKLLENTKLREDIEKKVQDQSMNLTVKDEKIYFGNEQLNDHPELRKMIGAVAKVYFEKYYNERGFVNWYLA